MSNVNRIHPFEPESFPEPINEPKVTRAREINVTEIIEDDQDYYHKPEDHINDKFLKPTNWKTLKNPFRVLKKSVWKSAWMQRASNCERCQKG